jgi:NTE family protein
MSKKYKIGIALSGGMFRGVAHIGVFQALREHEIEADVVIGTSAGAIAGALYAAGKTKDEMMAFVEKWAWIKAMRPSIPIDGLTSLFFLHEHLLEHIGHDSFEQLVKPMYIGATNMNEGRLEALNSGSLTTSIIASCSIPLVFKPVEIDGQLYIDGGIMSNMAVSPLEEECDIVIGVDVMAQGSVETKSLQNVLSIGQRVFFLTIVANSLQNVNKCDIVIQPEVGSYNIFNVIKKDFTNVYEAGYEAAMKQMPDIIQLIDKKVGLGEQETIEIR